MSRRGENIYKRRDGRWEGRILKKDGKYLYFYGKSYKEVKEKMRESPTKKKAEENVLQNDMPQAVVLFRVWLEQDMIKKIKPTTYESYYHCINKYVIPYFNQHGKDEITKENVLGFVNMLKEDTTIAETSKARVLAIFKTALKHILKDSKDCYYLLELVKFPKTHYKEVQVFSMNEQRLLEAEVLKSKDKRAIGIILCFYSGIRIGELCALKWSDIDTETGIMSISKTVTRIKTFQEEGKRTQLVVGTPKSRNSFRKIPLPSFLLKLVLECKQDSEKDNFIFSGKDVPLDPRVYQKLFKKILEQAKLEDRKFHAIRHTFATRALELGVDIKTLSEILGHSSVSITLNIYAHSLMDQKKLAIEKFNDMHLSSMNGTIFSVTSSVKV